MGIPRSKLKETPVLEELIGCKSIKSITVDEGMMEFK
jgi:hypothetical protein